MICFSVAIFVDEYCSSICERFELFKLKACLNAANIVGLKFKQSQTQFNINRHSVLMTPTFCVK